MAPVVGYWTPVLAKSGLSRPARGQRPEAPQLPCRKAGGMLNAQKRKNDVPFTWDAPLPLQPIGRTLLVPTLLLPFGLLFLTLSLG